MAIHFLFADMLVKVEVVNFRRVTILTIVKLSVLYSFHIGKNVHVRPLWGVWAALAVELIQNASRKAIVATSYIIEAFAPIITRT